MGQMRSSCDGKIITMLYFFHQVRLMLNANIVAVQHKFGFDFGFCVCILMCMYFDSFAFQTQKSGRIHLPCPAWCRLRMHPTALHCILMIHAKTFFLRVPVSRHSMMSPLAYTLFVRGGFSSSTK
jgi:hypothetical protein